jgi:uncharacterized membrane protein
MKVLLFTTILFSGLVAGLLYSYSTSVNPGLKTLPGNEYIRAMQSINTAIQNPVFFISFIGLLLLFPFTTYLLYNHVPKGSFYLFALAMAIYFIGVFGITMFFNVPLNEQLARFSLSTASQNEISAMRKLFEKPWNRYHTIRTILSIVSFALTILSVLKQKS